MMRMLTFESADESYKNFLFVLNYTNLIFLIEICVKIEVSNVCVFVNR